MPGFDLQSAYAQQQGAPTDASQGGGEEQSEGLTIPPDVAAQIAQAIQGNDCQTVCKLMGTVLAQGQGQ